MTTKKCPECLVPLRGDATSCACGWKSIPTPAKPSKSTGPVVDPDPWRCTHELLGQRCPEAAAFKRGDRWWCELHAGKKSLADTLASTVGREAIAKARALLAKAKPLQRVGHARPIGEELKPYEEAVAERMRDVESETEQWPAGRE